MEKESYLYKVKNKQSNQKIKVMKKEIIKTIEGELAVAKTEIDFHFPSLYTKEDVKVILDLFADTITTFVSEEVKEESSNKISVEGIEELKVALLGAITSKIDKLHSEDVVDFSTADFSIGNTTTAAYRRRVV